MIKYYYPKYWVGLWYSKTPLQVSVYNGIYEININIDVYRAQQQGYGHPLQLFLSRKMRKEAKPHGENTP